MSSKLQVKSKTKYRKVGTDETLHVAIDIGNGFVKAMIVPRFGEEIVFPHRVARLPESRYVPIERSAKFGRQNWKGTAIFRDSNGHGVVVGEHADGMPEGKRIAGSEKYTREHYGALLVAALLQLYPGGHPDVSIVVLHPANINQSSFEALRDSVKGVHKVTLPNEEKVTYKIRQIIPLEEPVAGLQTFILATNGNDYVRKNGIRFKPNTNVLVVDVGYELASLVPVRINRDSELEINIAQARVIDVGINNVVEALDREMREKFVSLNRKTKVPDEILVNALKTDSAFISGIEYKETPELKDEKGNLLSARESIAALVDRAMYPLASPIESYYKNDYNEGINFAGIIISGGGGAAAYNYLADNILKHNFVFPAEEELDRMQVGNIRGAAKGLIAFLGIQAQGIEEE